MTISKNKKLLLVGPTDGSVHVRNYYLLIKDYFEDVLVVTMQPVDFCKYEIADFSIRNPLSIPRKIKRLKQIITNYKPDVIHIHQANSCAYLTLKANTGKIPTVMTTWGSDVLLMPQMGMIHKYIVKYALKHSTVITADAKYMAKAISNLADREQTVVVNFGIDFDANTVIPQKENIIYSNRLHKDVYNIEQIVRGFAVFVKQHPDWKLVIGANGDLTEDLKKLSKEILPENSFEFIGFIGTDQNKAQYLKSKIWVSIPSSDGTSISLLEAMGYGCIPVVSDLPANKEWIENGTNGVVAISDLSVALNEALKLNQDSVQKLNRDIILKKGTKEVNRKMFYSIYDSILS